MVDEVLEIEELDNIEELSEAPVVGHSYDVLYTKFQELLELLQNNGIDYQLWGDFAVSLKYIDEFKPNKSVIQLHLNEKDMGNFRKICKTLSLPLQDRRLHSPKVLTEQGIQGDTEVFALYQDIPIIEVICFERLVDGTIISKQYYCDEVKHVNAEENIFSSKLAKEIFGNDKVKFFEYSVPVVSFEYLFIQKNIKPELKNFLELKIDNRRLSNIKSLMKTDKITQFVSVNELPSIEMISNKNSDNEISSLILDANATDMSETQNLEFLAKRQINKRRKECEAGYSNMYIVIVIILILLVVFLTGLVIYKLFIQ